MCSVGCAKELLIFTFSGDLTSICREELHMSILSALTIHCFVSACTKHPKSSLNTWTRPAFRRTNILKLVWPKYHLKKSHLACADAELHSNNNTADMSTMSDVMKSVLGCHTFQMNDTVCTYRDSHVKVDIASGKCLPIYQCRNGCASPQQTFGCNKKNEALSETHVRSWR